MLAGRGGAACSTAASPGPRFRLPARAAARLIRVGSVRRRPDDGRAPGPARGVRRSHGPVGVRTRRQAIAGVVERMFEVQAVISRTYALAHRGRHAARGLRPLLDDALPAVRAVAAADLAVGAAAREAVRPHRAAASSGSTRGPARALFHADCGGHTSTAVDVWGGAAPAVSDRARRRRTRRRGRTRRGRSRRAQAAVAARAQRRSADARRRSSRRDRGRSIATTAGRAETDRAPRHAGRASFAARCSARCSRAPSASRRSRSTLVRRPRGARRCSSSRAAASATASASARPARWRASERARRRPRSCGTTSRAPARHAVIGSDSPRHCRAIRGQLWRDCTERAESSRERDSGLETGAGSDWSWTLLRHRVDDDVDRELRVVLALEALVPPVVVPLAAVVLVAVEHADAPAVLDRAQVVVDDVVTPPVQLVRRRRRAVLEREEAAVERMLRRQLRQRARLAEDRLASPARSSWRRSR